MKTFNSIVVLCMLSGILSNVLAEDCKSGYNKEMCHMLCMMKRLAVGTCRQENGQDKCHCHGKRSLEENDETARDSLEEKILDSDEFIARNEKEESREENLGFEETRAGSWPPHPCNAAFCRG